VLTDERNLDLHQGYDVEVRNLFRRTDHVEGSGRMELSYGDQRADSVRSAGANIGRRWGRGELKISLRRPRHGGIEGF